MDRYYGEVEQLLPSMEEVTVQAGGRRFRGSWCFNSVFFGKIDKKKVNYLDQHFRGWFVRSETERLEGTRQRLEELLGRLRDSRFRPRTGYVDGFPDPSGRRDPFSLRPAL